MCRCTGALNNNFRHCFISFFVQSIHGKEPLRWGWGFQEHVYASTIALHTETHATHAIIHVLNVDWEHDFQDMYQEGLAFKLVKSSFVQTFKV
jgi:hypothetical protein